MDRSDQWKKPQQSKTWPPPNCASSSSASSAWKRKKASISDDIKDVFGEAKGRGYDTKAMKTIIRLRKKDANERIEEETILQTYMAALGME